MISPTFSFPWLPVVFFVRLRLLTPTLFYGKEKYPWWRTVTEFACRYKGKHFNVVLLSLLEFLNLSGPGIFLLLFQSFPFLWVCLGCLHFLGLVLVIWMNLEIYPFLLRVSALLSTGIFVCLLKYCFITFWISLIPIVRFSSSFLILLILVLSFFWLVEPKRIYQFYVLKATALRYAGSIYYFLCFYLTDFCFDFNSWSQISWEFRYGLFLFVFFFFTFFWAASFSHEFCLVLILIDTWS